MELLKLTMIIARAAGFAPRYVLRNALKWCAQMSEKGGLVRNED
jgi:hypothetical protein